MDIGYIGGTGAFLIVIGLFGCIFMIIWSSIIINNNNKKKPNDWSLEIFLPNMIFFILLGLGTMMYLLDETNTMDNSEEFYNTFIPILCAGSIFVSYLSVIFSTGIKYWKSD